MPAPPDEATTQPGDLWILGDHRLLCGDSSKPEDVDRLLDGATIHLVNTDPPYNVKVEPRSNNAIAAGNCSSSPAQQAPPEVRPGPASREGEADAQEDAGQGSAAGQRLRDRRSVRRCWPPGSATWPACSTPGRGFYIWGGYANCGNYPPVLKAQRAVLQPGDHLGDKQHPVLTRKDFMGNHRDGASTVGAKARRTSTSARTTPPIVWYVKKVNPQSMVHLTEKPV